MKLRKIYKADSVTFGPPPPPPNFLEIKIVLKTGKNVNFERTAPLLYYFLMASVKCYKETLFVD